MKTIAVGMCSEHLYEPVDPDLDIDQIQDLYAYLNTIEKDVYRCQSNCDALIVLLYLSGMEEELEIVGAYADVCVAITINQALGLGFKTRSPNELILFKQEGKSLEDKVEFYNRVPNLTGATTLINLGMRKPDLEFTYECVDGVHFFVPKE